MTTEKQIQAEILRVFGQRHDMRLWRSNCGVATMGVGPAARIVSFGVPGQADLSGIVCDGRRLEIEIKSQTGKQSKEQKSYQSMIERFGGIYILARSVEDVHSALEAAIDGYRR
jgi:hypothetical protein